MGYPPTKFPPDPDITPPPGWEPRQPRDPAEVARDSARGAAMARRYGWHRKPKPIKLSRAEEIIAHIIGRSFLLVQIGIVLGIYALLLIKAPGSFVLAILVTVWLCKVLNSK